MMNRVAPGLCTLLAALLVGCASPRAAAPSAAIASADAGAGMAAITPEGLLRDIRELASDRFLGRAVGTAGEDSTVTYLAQRFREMGLQPGMPDGGYLQRVPLVATTSRVEAGAQVGGRPC